MAYWPPPPPHTSTITSQIITHGYTIICWQFVCIKQIWGFYSSITTMSACHVYCICIHIIYVYMYRIYFIYIVINIISYNSCNYNHNIQFLNFILTVFQTSWGWLVMLDPWCRITFLTSNTTFKYSTSTLHNIYYSYDLSQVFSRGSINIQDPTVGMLMY